MHVLCISSDYVKWPEWCGETRAPRVRITVALKRDNHVRGLATSHWLSGRARAAQRDLDAGRPLLDDKPLRPTPVRRRLPLSTYLPLDKFLVLSSWFVVRRWLVDDGFV